MNNKDNKIMKFSDYLTTLDNYTIKSNKYSLKKLLTIVYKGNLSYYNLGNSFNFLNLDQITKNYYSFYIIKDGDNWNKIAYKVFGTIDAWWLICKLNNILNPFEKLKVGTIIKIPNNNLIELLTETLMQI